MSAVNEHFGMRCIVADPPWKFKDKLPGKTRGAERNYRTSQVAAIAAIEPYQSLVLSAQHAVLFLWRVSAMPQEALDLAALWGFRPHSELVWRKTTGKVDMATCRVLERLQQRSTESHATKRALERARATVFYESSKEHFGMGHVVRGAHETCLICVRGRPKILNKRTRSVFTAPVPRYPAGHARAGKVIHSAKPDAFYDIVERLVDGPRLELFARKKREGWTTLGDEVT